MMRPPLRGKRLLAAALALLLCLALLPGSALAADSGKTVRLEKFEGTVTIRTAGGTALTPSNRLRLQSGYTVETSAASYAWLSFDADTDNAKSVKLTTWPRNDLVEATAISLFAFV